MVWIPPWGGSEGGTGHTQNTDTDLGDLGTKNPPIDADKAVYRDSEAGDALKTSTWGQIKAFFKTHFDTVYNKLVPGTVDGTIQVYNTASGEWEEAGEGLTFDGSTLLLGFNVKIQLANGSFYRFTLLNGNPVNFVGVDSDDDLTLGSILLNNLRMDVRNKADAVVINSDGVNIGVPGTFNGGAAAGNVVDVVTLHNPTTSQTDGGGSALVATALDALDAVTELGRIEFSHKDESAGTTQCDLSGVDLVAFDSSIQPAGYNAADGTAGATADVATLAPDGATTRTLHFKNGLFTGSTDS